MKSAARQPHLAERLALFRRRCAERGLALTHQRLVIFEAIASSPHHPTPEMVFARVRRLIPSLSLATVYKSIRTFAEAGLVREVHPLHDTVRLDANLSNHHHLICVACKAVVDLDENEIGPVKLRGSLPGGFRAERLQVEVHGLCAACASARES